MFDDELATHGEQSCAALALKQFEPPRLKAWLAESLARAWHRP